MKISSNISAIAVTVFMFIPFCFIVADVFAKLRELELDFTRTYVPVLNIS